LILIDAMRLKPSAVLCGIARHLLPPCSRKNKFLNSLQHCIYETRSMSIDAVNCAAGGVLSSDAANVVADAALAQKEALTAQMAKIEAKKAKLKEYSKEYYEKKKLLLQELQAEADECAATGVDIL
jgi:hypothetical protein